MSNASSAWWRALREADRSVYGKAFGEVFIIGGISVLPLAIAAFGTFYLQDLISGTSKKSLKDILWLAVFGGQLYFYAMSFIGAVVWHSGQDFKKPFPLRIVFWGVSFVLGMVCTFFFGISPALSSTSVTGLSIASIIVYLLSFLMYFLILAFKEIEPPDVGQGRREGEKKLTDAVARRRGGAK